MLQWLISLRSSGDGICQALRPSRLCQSAPDQEPSGQRGNYQAASMAILFQSILTDDIRCITWDPNKHSWPWNLIVLVLYLVTHAVGSLCVCNIWTDVKLLWFKSVHICRESFHICRGVEQACRAPLNKALCSVLRISLETSSDVPALLWSPVVQGLLLFNCPCLLMGRGSTQEPQCQCQFIYFFTVATICIFAETM